MHSFLDQIGVVISHKPAVITADANGATVDLKNYGTCLFMANLGTAGDTLSASVKFEFELEESDNGTSWTDVADADLSSYVDGTNDGTFAVVDASAEAGQAYMVEYRGKKRYCRAVINVTGTHSVGTPISVTAIRGFAKVI